LASFVEEATLKVNDQSTAQINKINAALKKLFATANSLKSIKVDIKVNDRGITQALSNINKLKSAMSGLKSTTINIKANAAGLSSAMRQIQQLRAAAAKPITVNTAARQGAAARTPAQRPAAAPPAPPARRPPGAVPAPTGGRGLGGGGGYFRGPISVTGSVAVTNISALAGAAARATGRAAKEGYSQVDTADTKMALQRYPEQTQKAIELAVDQLQQESRDRRNPETGQGGVYWNRAQQKNLLVESMSQAGGDVAGASFLVKQAESLAKLGEGMGQSGQVAYENALSFIKAGEQMGRFRDAQGKFDYARATEYFDTMRQATRQIGQEFTGQKWLTTIGTAQQSKYGLDPKGMMTMALGMEESGSKFATGFNEIVKQFSGMRLDKSKLANLEALGLVDKGMVDSKGKPFAKTKVPTLDQLREVMTKGATDEGALRKNIHGYVQDKVLPAMAKLGMDPRSDADIGKFVGKVTSGKGSDILFNVIKRSVEWAQDIRTGLARPGDIDSGERDVEGSGRIAGTALRNQLTSTLGETINKMETTFVPLASGLADKMSKASEAISKGEAPDAPTMAAAVGAAIAAVPAMSLMGMAQGMRATMSEDPATSSLGSAGTSLNSAAGALTFAAGALAAAAGVKLPTGDLGGGPDKPGTKSKPGTKPGAPDLKKPTVPEPPKGGGLGGRFGTAVRWLLRPAALAVGAVTGLTAAAILAMSTQPAGGKSNQPEFQKLNDSLEDFSKIQSRWNQAQHEKEQITKDLASGATKPADVEAARAKLTALNTEIATLEQRAAAAKIVIDQATKTLTERAAAQVKKDEEEAAATKKKQEVAERARMTELERQAAERRAAAKKRGEEQPDPHKVYPEPVPSTPYVPKPPLVSTTEPTPVKVVEEPEPKPYEPPPGEGRAAGKRLGPPPPGEVTPAQAATSQIDLAGPLMAAASGIGAAMAQPILAASLSIGEAISAPIQTAMENIGTELGTAISEPMKAAGATLGEGLTAPIAAAGASIAAAGASFASAFGAASAQIASAGAALAAGGQQAAAAISSGASAAGSAYGAAAAAKISAAVANVSINVNHTGSGGGAGGSPGPVKEAN
jgi:hypothetical protein